MEIIRTPVRIPKAFKELDNPAWRIIGFKGGRGSAKSRSVGINLLLKARDESYGRPLRILCGRETMASIKDSSHRLLKDRIAEYNFTDFKVTNSEIINMRTGSTFIFKGFNMSSSNNPENNIKSIEGVDYCWIDEAQTLTERSLKILTPTIRNEGSQLIFTWNPLTEDDAVGKLFKRPRSYVRHVNYDENPFFPETLREEMEFDKEDDYDSYLHIWEGQPKVQLENAVLSRIAVNKAIERTVDDEGQDMYGVDVARFGDDRTVFYHRKGWKMKRTKVYKGLKVTEVAEKFEYFCKFDKKAMANIDDGAMGGGVVDILEDKGYKNVRGISFGGQAKNPDKYPNIISEMWFEFKDLLPHIELIEDTELKSELTTRVWKMDSKGRRCVEPKADYKKRQGRSPDKADGALLCYYTPKPKPTVRVRTL